MITFLSCNLLCSPHSATVQGETPWNPEILSREPNLNDSGAFYACGALLSFFFNMFCYGFQRNSELAAWHQDFYGKIISDLGHLASYFLLGSLSICKHIWSRYWMLSKSQSIRQPPVQARALGQVMDFQSSTESCCRPMKILKDERKPELWFVMFGSKQIWSQWFQAQKCLGFPRWFLASQCRWLLCNDVQQEQPSFCDHRDIQWHGRNYFRQQWRLKTARCWAVSVPRELKSSFGVASAVQFADGGICRCEDSRTASCWWSGLMSQKHGSFDSWDAMYLKHAECHGRCWTIWLHCLSPCPILWLWVQ